MGSPLPPPKARIIHGITKAQRIVEAMEQAAKEGKGAVSLDGRLIDIASIRQAQALALTLSIRCLASGPSAPKETAVHIKRSSLPIAGWTNSFHRPDWTVWE